MNVIHLGRLKIRSLRVPAPYSGTAGHVRAFTDMGLACRPATSEEYCCMAQSNARRIFLADDDEQMHDLLQVSAGRLGHQVGGVTLAQQVIPAVEREQPDIVVLDLAFPDGEGHDLLRQLKARPKTSRSP